MLKKIIYIISIIIFIILDLYLSFLTFLDYLAEYKTIKNICQTDYIIQEIKEQFKINYDIKEITFYSGIPDGYYLEIYNMENKAETVFDDNHEDSKIFDYFNNNVKADIPKHLKHLVLTIILEIIIVIMVKRKNNKLEKTDVISN